MLQMIISIMIFLGSALMVYNIYGFIRFARSIQNELKLDKERKILYLPIILLVFFLIGYIFVGIFGKPDLMMAGILFGGSIFVYLMYRFFDRVSALIFESSLLESQLLVARESNQAKSLFLHSISHEMRTPMNVIIGLDTIALRNPDLPPETRTQLEKIGLSARHLLGLINNILDINRIETGELVIRQEKFLLSDMIARLNAIVETLCSEKGLVWNLSADKEVEGIYIGDDLLVEQALLNFLDNAVKFTRSPGQVGFAVHLDDVHDQIRRLRFVISDTGEGIDPDFLPHIFEIFAREDASTTASHGGGGLSLSVSKQILDLMGGSVSADSKKGEGSVFTVTIPFIYFGEALPEHESEPVSDVDEELLSGLRILVVDDLIENAEIVEDLLELEGADYEYAENGTEALEMFNRSPEYYYDAVLMDIRMPVMNGLDASRQIRNLDRPDAGSVPIIALTANTADSDIRETMDAGMNAHLSKPVDADLMYNTIREMVSSGQNSVTQNPETGQ